MFDMLTTRDISQALSGSANDNRELAHGYYIPRSPIDASMDYYPTGTSNPGHYGTADQYQGAHGPIYQHHAQGTLSVPYASGQNVSIGAILRLFTLFSFRFTRHATFIMSLELMRNGPRDITTLAQTFIDLLHGLRAMAVFRPLKCPWYVPTP
jgi:hypothetical protein